MEDTMIKRIIALFAAILTALTLAGCDGTGPGDFTNGASSSSRPYVDQWRENPDLVTPDGEVIVRDDEVEIPAIGGDGPPGFGTPDNAPGKPKPVRDRKPGMGGTQDGTGPTPNRT
jgi:hypothetical protein